MNPLDRFDVRDQVALVTGGSGVLGSAMACELAAAGMRVAILARRVEMCQQVVNAITATAGTAVEVASSQGY